MNALEKSCILITGIMASGKSTVAQHLAEALPKSVHLRGDVFRRMIVNGQAQIEPPISDEAMAQLRLRYQLAADATDRYCQTGFTVVYQDVILGDVLNEVVVMHTNHPLYVVVLCPQPDVVWDRDTRRHKQTYQSWTPDMLDQSLRTETPQIGLWVDSTHLTISETVAFILNNIQQARINPPD